MTYTDITDMANRSKESYQEENAQLKQRIKELEKALAFSKLETEARDLMITRAEEYFDIPIRKKIWGQVVMELVFVFLEGFGDGCDGRTGINAQSRHRLDVGLNAGPSATVGSGNSQCCIVFHIFFIFILFILDLLIYL